MNSTKNTECDSLAIIFHSGAYDRISYGLITAKAALAMGIEVNTFFTFEAVRRLARGSTDLLGEETVGEVRDIVDRGLTTGILQPISEQIRDAKRIGLKIYACITAMTLFGLSESELIEEVDKVAGAGTILDLARVATISFYI